MIFVEENNSPWVAQNAKNVWILEKYQVFNDDPGARDLDMQTQVYYILWVFPPRT